MGDSCRFSNTHGIVGLIAPLADNYNAGMTMDSINMAKYNHCTIIITGSASVAGTGILTIYGGATDGATTAAITFTYRYCTSNIGAAGGDVYEAAATSAALTITEANLISGVLLVEFDAEDLNVSGVQYQYATPALNADGTAGIISACAILSEPRYQKSVMPTAIPTS